MHRSWQAFNRKQAEPYQAYDAPPAGVLAALQKATAAITEALAEMPLAQDDPVLAFHFEALHFQRLAGCTARTRCSTPRWRSRARPAPRRRCPRSACAT